MVGGRLQVLIRKTERRWPRRGCRWDAMTLQPSPVACEKDLGAFPLPCIPCVSLQGPCAAEFGSSSAARSLWLTPHAESSSPHCSVLHPAASSRNSNLEFQLWGWKAKRWSIRVWASQGRNRRRQPSVRSAAHTNFGNAPAARLPNATTQDGGFRIQTLLPLPS